MRRPVRAGGSWTPRKSIPNQSETYNANPNYWNPDVVHVQQIVITHINDINARHNALESGQIDIVDDGAVGRKKDMEAKGFRSIAFPVTDGGRHHHGPGREASSPSWPTPRSARPSPG